MNECLRIPGFAPEPREVLPGLWYLACPASAIKPGQKWPVEILDRSILLGRLNNGELFAYHDLCPGCGVPLRYGTFENDRLSCCLQGWRFDALDGACIDSPSNAGKRYTSAMYLRLHAIPIVERYGQVWILSQDTGKPSVRAPFFPRLPIAENEHPQISTVLRLPSNVEPASGVFDPGHPAFMCTSNWGKEVPASGVGSRRREFEATALGFRVRSHGLKPRATPYRLFGPEISLDIEVRLPGIRIEHISGSRNSACILTATTPALNGFVDVHCAIYWTMPWLTPAKPILRYMLRTSMKREHDVAARPEVVKQLGRDSVATWRW
jgi:nitrite reductase/ring-hydroxylating ferredoxin subunit